MFLFLFYFPCKLKPGTEMLIYQLYGKKIALFPLFIVMQAMRMTDKGNIRIQSCCLTPAALALTQPLKTRLPA